MKTILVVDDDAAILTTLVGFLTTFSDELEVLTARNGREAVETLDRHQEVDLLLTDLYMPVMDGFELLAHMMRSCPAVPIIVMSGYEVPEMGDRIERQGALHYLEKPFSFETLGDTVRETLARTSKGHLTGVSLLGFLQLLNFEKKSCTLVVKSGPREGRIHVLEGELVNAEYDRFQGETAVFEILAWDDCEFDVNVPQHVERLIYRPLHGVILEAAKDLDESRSPARRREEAPQAASVSEAEDDSLARLRSAIPAVFERSSLGSAGAIGLAMVDVQQGEILGYRCFQYWPDFTERATATAPALRRRLELDDGEQVEEVLTVLEALVELWRPLGKERRLVFYLLMNRHRSGLDMVRTELSELAGQIRALLAE